MLALNLFSETSSPSVPTVPTYSTARTTTPTQPTVTTPPQLGSSPSSTTPGVAVTTHKQLFTDLKNITK